MPNQLPRARFRPDQTSFSKVTFDAVLLDRDGTIIRHVPYLSDPAQVELEDHAVEGLKALANVADYLIVCSNQSAVGRGFCSITDVEAVNFKMVELLAFAGVTLDKIYYCPHHPNDGCECRKPKTKMAHWAAELFSFDLTSTVVIGDSESDVVFGKNIRAASVLISKEPENNLSTRADLVASDLLQAARLLGDLGPNA